MRSIDKVIEYGMLAFVFLIPWQARLIISGGAINGGYWEYGTRSLYATEVLLFLVLLAVVIKGGAYALSARPRFSLKRLASPAGALLALIAWAGISIFWSIDRSVGLEHWLVLVEAGAVFLILASGAVPVRQLSWAVMLSGSIQAILAFVQFRLQEVTGSTWLGMAYQHASVLGASVVETDTMRMLRAYGSFPHPNMLGGWLVLGLLLAIQKVGTRRSPVGTRRGVCLPAYIPIAILSVGLAVTFSRSAWLAFGVGLAGLVAAWTLKAAATPLRSSVSAAFGVRAALALMVITLFVGTLVIAYPEPFKERVFGEGRLEAKSYEERSGGISEALQLIKQHLAIGVGIGNYGLGVHRDIDANQPSHYYQPVHNVPLLILAELGVIGILAFGFLILSFFHRHPERAYSRAEGSRWLSAGVFLLPLMVIALFDHYLWSLYAGVMIGAVYLGIFYLKLAKS